MPIEETKPKKKKKVKMPNGKEKEIDEDEVETILDITLPSPPQGNPQKPLSIGKHNSCAIKNFREVGNLLISLNKNQKVIVNLINENEKKVKKLKKDIRNLSKNIKKLLKEDDENS